MVHVSEIHLFAFSHFAGDITFRHGVLDLVVLRGSRDITVHGCIEAADVQAGRDLAVHHVICGKEKGVVRAGGVWEERLLRKVAPFFAHAGARDLFVDVGAHVGSWAVALYSPHLQLRLPDPSERAPAAHRTLAVEAQPEMAALLAYNVAANGLEVLAALGTLRYDLVLMDVQMPEMDGLETTRAIRDPATGLAHARIPIIAMTAHALKGDRDRCLEAGMNDYVSKPVRPQELVAAIERQLRGRAGPPAAAPAGAAADLQEPVIFSLQEVTERLGMDRTVLDQILTTFLEELPVQIENLRRGFRDQDARLVERQAHTLKGASGIIGAQALQAAAERVETAGRARDLVLAESLFAAMQGELERLQVVLVELMNTPA